MSVCSEYDIIKTWIIEEDISFASSKVILLFIISPDSMTSSYIANTNTRFSKKNHATNTLASL